MPDLLKFQNVVVISDLHIGDGNVLDDFKYDIEFRRLLGEIIPTRAGWPATLVINGDFIDFPQVFPEWGLHRFGDRFGCTEEESVQKTDAIIKAHPGVFAALSDFIGRGGQVVLIPGNHDVDLFWKGVWSRLRKAVGDPPEDAFLFVKQIQEGRILIEHGHQYSYDNYFKYWIHPIFQATDGNLRLERPWGTLFLDTVYNDIELRDPFVNKVYPHSRLALIGMKSVGRRKGVSLKMLAALIAFLVTDGKRFLWERLMGTPREEALSIASAARALGIDATDPNYADLVTEVERLVGAQPGTDALNPNLLGRTDAAGLAKRMKDLWLSGEIDLVVFGHTHKPVDGSLKPPYGLQDARRTFNTGSWMPAIPLGDRESVSWDELRAKTTIHAITFLIINLQKPHPMARLEPLLRPNVSTVTP